MNTVEHLAAKQTVNALQLVDNKTLRHSSGGDNRTLNEP